jgi:adenylate cyclase
VFVKLRGTDAGLSAFSYDACSLWLLGYPDQAQKRSREAIAAAEKFSHPFTSAEVLTFSGCLHNEMRRDFIKLKDDAERLIETARFVGLAWSGAGFRYRGEALALLGQVEEGKAQIQKGLRDDEISAARCFITSILGNLAYASAKAGEIDSGLETLEQVFARMEKSDERYAEAELNRIKGEISLIQGKEAEAEASYQRAIDIAQMQQAKTWELRATTSLARLWQRQGKIQEAKQALSEVYAWFTEGFDMLDLREARGLLNDLG